MILVLALEEALGLTLGESADTVTAEGSEKDIT